MRIKSIIVVLKVQVYRTAAPDNEQSWLKTDARLKASILSFFQSTFIIFKSLIIRITSVEDMLFQKTGEAKLQIVLH